MSASTSGSTPWTTASPRPGSELRAAFEHEMRSQAASFEQGLRALITTVVFGLASVVLTMAGLAFALARFT